MEMNFSSSSLPIFLSPLRAFLTIRLGNILINIKRQDVEMRHTSNIYFSEITFHSSRPKWRGKSVMNFQPDVEVGEREIVTRKIIQNTSKELNDMCKFNVYACVVTVWEMQFTSLPTGHTFSAIFYAFSLSLFSFSLSSFLSPLLPRTRHNLTNKYISGGLLLYVKTAV